MADVIQAKCPHCKQVLRVPADWVGRSLRCKHCKQVFQAKGKAPASPPAPAAPAAQRSWLSPADPAPAAPVAARPAAPLPPKPAAPARRSSGDPFAFDENDDSNGELISGRRRRKGGWWKGATVAVLAIAIAGGVGYFFRDNIALLFNPEAAEPIAIKDKDPKDPDHRIAEGPKNGGRTGDDGPPSGQQNKKSSLPPSGVGRSPQGETFPRRALLINVNNYLLANAVEYGSNRMSGSFAGASTGVLKDTLTRRPFNIPPGQIVELADGSKTPFATLKPVIEAAITDFLTTSREQDRIILLFAGHAIDHDMESYLVPWEGDLKNKDTLIPLSWLYEKLAACKARQKVLVLDVCRMPTAKGFELPGGGAGAPNYEMTEQLDAKLQSPPPGVQVWTACVKGQNSIEFGTGSLFMEALCALSQKVILPRIPEPPDPLPLEIAVNEVNTYMKRLLAAQKMEQASRLSGKEPDKGAAYNPAELPPTAMTLKLPAPAGTKFAGKAVIQNILDEINLIPPAKASQLQASKLEADKLPAFAMADLDQYKPDYRTLKELQDMVKGKPEQYALRDAVLKAAGTVKDTFRFSLEESLGSPGGDGVSAAVKKGFLAKQKEPGMAIFQLETALAELKAAGEKRDEETSKRWQAHYDYCMARMMSRIVFVYEYDYILAQVRSDSLPTLEKVHNGWRVGSRTKVQISEGKVKDMVKQINRTWEKIAADHPGTPWALMAKREQLTALGLEWRPSRD